METLSTDMLLYFAMILDYPDILNLCSTNYGIHKKVCRNSLFWLNKIKKDYPNRKNLEFYGDTYKKIYKNLRYGITIYLSIRIRQYEEVKKDYNIISFSHPIAIDDNTISNIGKYVVYIISLFADPLWEEGNNDIRLTVLNKNISEFCSIKPWKNASCLKYINYDTEKIIADINIERDYDMDYNIENFSLIVKHVNENLDKNPIDWPQLDF